MPQPDSTRRSTPPEQWSEPNAGWPADPAAPRQRRHSSTRRRMRGHVEDARHGADIDGNEEQERQARDSVPSSREAPSSQLAPSSKTPASQGASGKDETSEWVAGRPFGPEDELEDTWPNLPGRRLEEE
jgi:hypothetical protein